MGKKGFTIVELLIVIVVIAILAAITIVAFNGIQNRANDTSVKTDLANLMKQFELYKVDNGTYPLSNTALESLKVRVTKSAYLTAPNTTYNLVPCLMPGGATMVIAAISKSGDRFYTGTNTGGVKQFEGASSWTGVDGYSVPCVDTLPGSNLPVGSCNAIGYCASWRLWLQ